MKKLTIEELKAKNLATDVVKYKDFKEVDMTKAGEYNAADKSIEVYRNIYNLVRLHLEDRDEVVKLWVCKYELGKSTLATTYTAWKLIQTHDEQIDFYFDDFDEAIKDGNYDIIEEDVVITDEEFEINKENFRDFKDKRFLIYRIDTDCL